MMSNNQESIALASEIISDIIANSVSLTNILRKCYNLSLLVESKTDVEWIKNELNGYSELKYSELETIAPHRKVKLLFYDEFNRPIVFNNDLAFFHDEIVSYSIPHIENHVSGGMLIIGGPLLDIIRKEGYTIQNAKIQSADLNRIIENVKNKALDFAISVKRKENDNLETIKKEKLNKMISTDAKTENSRLLLFDLENRLRMFIAENIEKNQGIIDESIRKSWEKNKQKEFLPIRQPLQTEPINYSNFEQLRLIVTQNENWEKIFRKYFGRRESVISRINELDDIRDTIAHNRIISEFDYNSLKTLYGQIIGCLENII